MAQRYAIAFFIGDYYMMPVEHREDWRKWEMLDNEDPAAAKIPEFARRIAHQDSLSALTFSDPVVEAVEVEAEESGLDFNLRVGERIRPIRDSVLLKRDLAELIAGAPEQSVEDLADQIVDMVDRHRAAA